MRPVFDEWEWQGFGACRDADPEIFFLEHNLRHEQKRKKEKTAVQICKTCPVIQQCLEHSLKVPEFYGVWGGMTADQRVSMLRKQGFKGTR